MGAGASGALQRTGPRVVGQGRDSWPSLFPGWGGAERPPAQGQVSAPTKQEAPLPSRGCFSMFGAKGGL